MRTMEQEANRIIKNNDYYDILNSKSLRLQNRVSPIVKALEFDTCESADVIIRAIEYFKQRDGNIDSNAPLDFLDSDERKLVFDSEGKLRVSLYKVMFFQHIANSIKSGALNLKHSFKYRTFEHYLIPKERWLSEKDELLERAGLTGITGLGCNHGIDRISKISRHINLNELEYAVNWHFSGDNLIRANDKVLQLTQRLPLHKLSVPLKGRTQAAMAKNTIFMLNPLMPTIHSNISARRRASPFTYSLMKAIGCSIQSSSALRKVRPHM